MFHAEQDQQGANALEPVGTKNTHTHTPAMSVTPTNPQSMGVLLPVHPVVGTPGTALHVLEAPVVDLHSPPPPPA